MTKVRAVLGPTNTGKTHLAVERMLAHGSGMIGLPLRLLAREIYDRIVKAKGVAAAGLVTGEERIVPDSARWFACTVEAMSPRPDTDFVAVDEVQLAADPDRGHVFTDRILHARGRFETMLLGADTVRPALAALDLQIDSERRERFSSLSYAGPLKITKLPKRSAIVAFSAEEVYAIAELLRRQRGGAAVVMGALSPRTRNAQVALYQSGEVDYIVATDAIGMGLNMDVGHVAFASRRKFDGRRRRPLRADEAAQIAGRAGRFRDDGTFGETADCEPFEPDIIGRIEGHAFEPLEGFNWRNSDLDWKSVDALLASLRRPSPHPVLRRAPEALDESTLAILAQSPDIRGAVRSPAHVRRLWDLCTLPDFRKSGVDAHVKLVSQFAERLLEPTARIKDDWMYAQVSRLDRPEGDIDTLQQRLADIRTWTYAANRSDWLENAETWRGRAREIEDRLSDALHERLMQRFVDRRTSALLKSLSSEDDLAAEIAPDGRVSVGGHPVGRLEGLVFHADVAGQTLEGRALRNAASRALRPVIEQRLARIAAAEHRAFRLDGAGRILLDDEPVAVLARGGHWLSPAVTLAGGDDASAPFRDAARERLQRWIAEHVGQVLAPAFALREAMETGALSGLGRGTAHQLLESGLAIDRRADETTAALTHDDRQALGRAGVRAGRVAACFPQLLKPGPARLALVLRSVWTGEAAPEAPVSASFALADRRWRPDMLAAAGYVRLGGRAVRADMAERLSHAVSLARREQGPVFALPPELAATIGCPGEAFADVVAALGLKPAERGEAGAVARWRYVSVRAAEKRQEKAREKAVVDSPFAALSGLVLAPARAEPVAPKAKRPPRRRRKPRPPVSPAPDIQSDVDAPILAPTDAVE